MGGEEVVMIAVTGMIFVYGTVRTVLHYIFGSGAGRKSDKEILQELAELKTEVRELRQQNRDLILSVDNTMTQVERALTAGERARTAQHVEPQQVQRLR